jgi:hypothetical protein
MFLELLMSCFISLMNIIVVSFICLLIITMCLCIYRGFCYFNSVAIAAKQLKEKLKLEKILIVDWVSQER